LLCAVEPPRREQLFGADHAEPFPHLRPDPVLPALAAIEREIRSARAKTTREVSKQLGAFVIRVRARMQHARDRLQSPQRERET
jgi:hypothetical protein